MLRGIVEKQQENARCRAAHMLEPHTFSRDELEFADPATAKTHNGEGEVVVSDKDRLDHHIHDDLKLKADWECARHGPRQARL